MAQQPNPPFTPGGGSGRGGGGGSITGNQMIDSALADTQAMMAGGMQPTGAAGQRQQSPHQAKFDQWRSYFTGPRPVRTPAWARVSPDDVPTGDDRDLPTGLRDPSGRSTAQQRRTEEAFIAQQAADERRNNRTRLEQLATRSGLVGEGHLPSELDTVWQSAIDTAQASTQMGEVVEPWDILEHWANDPEAAREFVQAQPSAPPIEDVLGGEPASRTVVRTNTTTHLTDENTARAVAEQGLRQHLGRAPREGEVEQYTRFLGSLERENPTVSTVTQQVEGGRTVEGEMVGGEVTDTSTETTGGAPEPTQALGTFVEDEHSDEAYAYRLASQGDQLLRSLVGSLV